MAVFGYVWPRTGSGVYGREQPCTLAVNTPGYKVHGRVRVINGPCTWPVNGRVHGLYTAVQTGNGRGHGP